MKRTFLSLLFILQLGILSAQKNFSFVFLPDIHLQPDSSVIGNFENIVRQINRLHPDFVITGGDMIYTAKNGDEKNALQLFSLMDKEFLLFKMPVYLTMGNHENVGITGLSSIDKTNPAWGKQLYEKRYSKRFYSFSHKGWKFFILDGIRIREKEKDYTGGVDSVQIGWLKKELEQTGENVNIGVVVHTPFINPHSMTNPESRALSDNSATVLNLFRGHNLRMVLQGHNHIYMNLFINGVYYISGGSTLYNTDPDDYGFSLISVHGNNVKIKFIPTSEE